jgi:hypothetical protein
MAREDTVEEAVPAIHILAAHRAFSDPFHLYFTALPDFPPSYHSFQLNDVNINFKETLAQFA